MNPHFSRMLPSACSFAGALLLVVPNFASARVWTSSDGKPLSAEFVALQGENVMLRIPAGRTIPVPLSRLIKADQDAAKRFAVLGDDSLTLRSAKMIDALLAKGLVKGGLRSFNQPLPDDLFARRVYLDIIGRIPTREEFAAFAENARPDKREALIDQLLLHQGRASHLFNYFADMYRLNGNADFAPGQRAEPYIQWWKDQLAKNAHYDEMVREMITANGNMGQNPASGFLLRDAGMEFDAFANFGQIQLGIDISCAQCHDHPFADWVRADFYEMAAYFGNTQRTMGSYAVADSMSMKRATMPNAPDGWVDKFKQFAQSKGLDLKDPDASRPFNFYVNNALGWNVADNPTMEHPVPTTVSEIGGTVFKPRPIIGDKPGTGGKTRRQALAEWLTSKDNPRFALVIANRMWSRAFGRALLEPVKDFPVDWAKTAGQPEVAAFVAQEMKRVNYDLREFMRILYNTKAYQSYASAEEPATTSAYLFAGPVLRRLRAEQAWDSLMLLAEGPKVDEIKGRDGSFYRELLNVNFEKDSFEAVWTKYEAFKQNRGKGYGTSLVLSPESGSLAGSEPDVPKLGNLELIRASEMAQPAPSGSLVDVFGQSDRIITDQHTFDGSVPQVLALMNGVITERLTGPGSKVVEDLKNLDAVEDKVRGVFNTMLSRFPSDDEQAMGVEMLTTYGDDGIRDLAWALMNSPEFLFIQ
jgi:hypothetical protein